MKKLPQKPGLLTRLSAALQVLSGKPLNEIAPYDPYDLALQGLPVSEHYQSLALRQQQLAEKYRGGKHGGVAGLAAYTATVENQLKHEREINGRLRDTNRELHAQLRQHKSGHGLRSRA